MKGSNVTHSLARSQHKGLSKHQRRASWLHTSSPPCSPAPHTHTRGREVGVWQPEPDGKGQSEPQRLASSTKLWAGYQLLTTSSWDPRWLTSARRVTAWDQFPRRDTAHTWDSTVTELPGNQVARTGEVIKMHGPPGTVHSSSTSAFELLGHGKGTKHTPIRVCALAEYLRTWTWAA